MRPRSCNALTVFRVADRDRVNFAVFESAQQHIAAQQFGLKLIAVLQVREQPVRFRSSRKAPQSTVVLCQVVTVCALLAIESGSSATLTLGLLMGWSAALYQASSLGIRGERRRHPMELHTIGIDLGKTSSHWVLNEKVNSAFAE